MKYKALLVLLITFILSGCNEATPEAMLENYIYRLSNALESDEPAKPPIPIRPLFPPRRDRIIETPELREGVLDVLKLQECGLVNLIAERNSSLGKVLRPSLKMAYELKFIIAVDKCRSTAQNQPEPDPELNQLLTAIYEHKSRYLINEIWNGIYSSESFETNFSRKFSPHPILDNQSTSASINALKLILGLVEQDFRTPKQLSPNYTELEAAYKVLYSNSTGPQLISSLELLTQQLQRATILLNKRLDQRPLCFQQRPNPQAKIMHNVFFKYYIGEVQPYLATVHRYVSTWFELNRKIYDQLINKGIKDEGVMQSYFRQLLAKENPESSWSRYLEAKDQHTLAWQNLLKQCGMMPTKRT